MKKYIAAVLITISLASPLSAAGAFSMGLMLGVAGDGGSVSKVTEDLNFQMRQIKGTDPGAEINELPVYYTPCISVNFRYLYDKLLLQLGWEYAATFYYNEKGSVKPSLGSTNEIEIKYSRFTFPLTAGIVIPASRRTRFYMGGGINVSFVMLEIMQSNPGIFTELPDKRNSYSGYIPGYHAKFGAETILSRNYSLVLEYTRYMGKNRIVESDNGNSSIYMGLNTFEIAAGINYTIDTGL